ncbi:Integrator complex subunit 9-like [Paramuricea clavata]|uniref:Integrator complex subunit 9-like n=1 Tax=Paramuricea clavata TaxID=317549 RepID=A0A7D9IBG7_PARCT|nr:Integrator complex subunit 9-like [Paramuricea clavata]
MKDEKLKTYLPMSLTFFVSIFHVRKEERRQPLRTRVFDFLSPKFAAFLERQRLHSIPAKRPTVQKVQRNESRQLKWVDEKLCKDQTTGNVFLLWEAETGCKTRHGDGYYRAFNHVAQATSNDRCPVKFYKEFCRRGPDEMKTAESPFYLAIKRKRMPQNPKYLREKKLDHPENSEELASVLKSFYAEVRKKDWSEYTKNSLCYIRFGLNIYFKSVFNNDIIKDKEFEEANGVYEAHCVYLKKRGLAKTEHKPPIADEDIKKLYESSVFNTDSPATLQNKVFFEIMFFCRRRRQNFGELKSDDFAIKTNPQGNDGCQR